MSIDTRLADIQATIQKTRIKSPIAAPRIMLLGASKGQNAALIEDAIQNGVGAFGENRVQEAWEKWPEIKKRHPNVQLHLIGPLQTNKVEDALKLFDVIQTVDRPKLAVAIAKMSGVGFQVSENENVRHPSPVTRHLYIQINTGEEPQKAGILPAEADDFIDYCRGDLTLPVMGLMCVPPADQPSAPHFALLRKIALTHRLPELSMGMSGDYETAVRMGSTCVRIGTALFGERDER